MLSRYLFGKFGLRYRIFYDRLFEILKEHPLTRDAIGFVEQVETYYLSTGKVADAKNLEVNFDFPKLFGVPQSELPPGHFMKDLLNKFVYEHINELRDIAVQMVREDLGYDVPEEVVTFNNAYMYNEQYEYPLKVTLDYNILEESEEQTTYTLMPKILEMDNKFKKKDPVMFYKQGAYKSNLKTEKEAPENSFGQIQGKAATQFATTTVHASSTTDHPTDIGYKSPADINIEDSNAVSYTHLTLPTKA